MAKEKKGCNHKTYYDAKRMKHVCQSCGKTFDIPYFGKKTKNDK